MYRAGLILEGGGTRGVFTSGVLDAFMKHNIYFSYLIGVSAGACNLLNYASGQIERTKKCTIDCLEQEKYISLKNLIKSRSLFDMDFIFDTCANRLLPFDSDAYFAYPGRKILGCTNCLTGKPYYFEESSSRKRLLDGCRASSSLPFISPEVVIDGIPLLDGGVSDAVPIRKSIKDGNKKNVIVLTRPKGYRKKVKEKQSPAHNICYSHYPLLVEQMHKRTRCYNKTMDLIERLEGEGRVFVIRPSKAIVSRTEQDSKKLTAFYLHGYQTGCQVLPTMVEYLTSKQSGGNDGTI